MLQRVHTGDNLRISVNLQMIQAYVGYRCTDRLYSNIRFLTCICRSKRHYASSRNMNLALKHSLETVGRTEISDASFRNFLNCETVKTNKVYGPLVPSILDRCRNLSYRVRPLSDVPDNIAQNLLAECFVRKGDLEAGATPALTAADFVPELRNAWPALLKHSFVLLNSEDDNIAGVYACGDAHDLARVSTGGCHPYMIEILTYLDGLYLRVNDELPQDPKPGLPIFVFIWTSQSQKNFESRGSEVWIWNSSQGTLGDHAVLWIHYCRET